MSSKPGRNLLLHYAIILFASIAITAPIYLLGIPNGNDLPQHYQFAQTIESSLAEGVLYPSWSLDPNFGFGDIGIRFYPPLSYYVLVGAKSIGGNWYNASVITFAFWFFIGGTGIYKLTREWFSERSALAAALIFLIIPYHANQIFNAFMYAEFAATAVLPYCLLFAYRTCRRGSILDVVGLAASYSILIITHLPLTVIGSISLLLFSLASLRPSNAARTTIKLAAAVAISLAATGFYWVRVICELSLIKHADADLAGRAYDYRINFLFSYFNTPTADYLDRSLIFSDLMLIATLAVAAAGSVVFFIKEKDRRRLTPLIALLASSVFFATPISSPLWERLEFLSRVQFPWRWLAVISIAAVVLAASGVDHVLEFFRNEKRPVALIITGITAAVAAFTIAQVIRPAVYIEQQQFESRITALKNAKGCECFWPVTANNAALLNPEILLPQGRAAESVLYSANLREYRVSPGSPGQMRLPLFYYPYWHASVNGVGQKPLMDTSGAVLIELPSESAKVLIQFEEPLPYRVAAMISLIASIALLAIGIFYFSVELRKLLRPDLPDLV